MLDWGSTFLLTRHQETEILHQTIAVARPELRFVVLRILRHADDVLDNVCLRPCFFGRSSETYRESQNANWSEDASRESQLKLVGWAA